MNSENNTSTTIKSINDLVTALSEGERTTYNTIFRSANIPISEFDDFCVWSDDSYTRNCVFEDERFELILLCWEEGQKTPIHDHGGEECWVKIVEGAIEEELYTLDEMSELQLIKTDIAKKNDISYMIDFMGFHSLKNVSNGRSMSLHLYAKPIKKCNIFDENLGKFICQRMVYTTVPTTIEN